MDRSDYHIHTQYCGHTAPDLSIQNIVKAAERQGLKAIAITEHSFEWKVSQAEKIKLILNDVKNVETAVRIHVGMEICPDFNHEGNLIFEDFEKDSLSPVLAGTHIIPVLNADWYLRMNLTDTEKKQIYIKWFRTMEKLLRNPKVDVLAHPGRMIMHSGIITEFAGAVLRDFGNLFDIARACGVAVELNESLFKKCPTEKLKESYSDLIRLALEKGLKISTGSDAHRVEDVGNMPYIEKLMEKLNIREENLFHPSPTNKSR